MKKNLSWYFTWVLLLASLLAGCTSVGAATLAADTPAPGVTPTAGLATGVTVGAPAAPTATATEALPVPTPAPTATAAIPWATWPVLAWATASPEQVGMDSARLQILLDFLDQQKLDLHSLLIIRRGYLVFELNPYPNTAATPQEIQSATKSVTSALVGIALEEGYLHSLDQKVLDFFPKRTIANLDARKKAMTLRDLLTMTSGLDWPEATTSYTSRDNPVRAMWSSGDPLGYVLDRPMAAAPGTTFNYNTGNSQVLGAIIEQVSGQTLSEFADQHLFEPLGIHGFSWHRMLGVEPGGSGLVLTARDMAKLGYLYLRGGAWAGRHVLPAAWVADSTVKHAATPAGGYGYQWWINPNGGYTASGFGGQSIEVFPGQDLVVVATGAMGATQRTTLHNLVTYFILPAVVSNEPLAAGKASVVLKARLLAAAAQPVAKVAPALPKMAAKIAGVSYTLEANSLSWKQVRLEFIQPGEATLVVEYTGGGGARIPIGLDGAPRVAQALRIAAAGEWSGEATFTLEYEPLGSADGQRIEMSFEGKQVVVRVTSYVQGDVSVVGGVAK